MINIGSLLLVLVYLIVLIIFYACTWMIKHKKFMHYRNKIVDGLFWNSVISFITEAYMQLTVSCIINLLSLSFTSYGTVISSLSSLLALIVCLGFPIFSFCFLSRNRDKLRESQFKEKFESLYEGLNHKHGHYIVLAEPFFGCARVLILISALILL